MKHIRLSLVSAAALLGFSVLSAQAAPWWEEMDYGRFLSASYLNADGKSTLEGLQTPGAANKGIAVKLGKVESKTPNESEAAQIFDTDLLRVASGWTGGWVKLKGVVFDGAHGPNPGPATSASIYFQTNSGTPGWSKAEDFTDPRKLPTGPGAAKVPFGPLPKDWAKYRGFYLSGDNVVFAYTVGDAIILEMPGVEKVGDELLLTRTFNVLANGAGASLLLAEGPAGTKADLSATAQPGAEGEAKLTDMHVIASNDAKTPESRVIIGTLGAPAAAKLVVDGPRSTLKFPALVKGQSFKVVYAKGKAADEAKLAAALQLAAKPADLTPFTQGGPLHWKETVKAKGVLAGAVRAPSTPAPGGAAGGGGNPAPATVVPAPATGPVPAIGVQPPGTRTPATLAFPYVIDDLSVPLENPYKSRIRIAGLDFFADGRIAFSTWSGDVWIGTGIDEKLENIEWKRYATGLFHALGLKIVDDKIYVLGRDQITRLHDLNKDGEADLYENFNNDVQVTPGFHEFTFGLETDSKGNFYFAKAGPVNPGGRGWGPLGEHHGCLLKVSKDGQKLEVYATGLRAPNGIGVGPNDEVSNGDNQGTWVPADYIHISKPGDFISVADLAHKDPVPTDYTPHLCWLPMDVDNSNGSQVWVTSDKWGPLKGQMIYLSYGKCAIFNVLQEKVGEVRQGGVVKFPLKFTTGVCRARFSPVDGQLYLGGLKGWQTDAVQDGAIQRVRYTGGPLMMQSSLQVTDKGIRIGFTNRLDSQTSSDVNNYAITQYNYKWSSDYGSEKYKVSSVDEKGKVIGADPSNAKGEKGTDTLKIKAVTLAPDRRSLFLEVEGLKPVMQMEIKMNIRAADGTAVPDKITNTINVLPPNDKAGEPYVSLPPVK